jgi:hypothetical protein
MKEKDIKRLVELRTNLIKTFSRLKDYKSNKNAIMREIDHAEKLHATITSLDDILKEYVEFKN